jgi:hypothetical protein
MSLGMCSLLRVRVLDEDTPECWAEWQGLEEWYWHGQSLVIHACETGAGIDSGYSVCRCSDCMIFTDGMGWHSVVRRGYDICRLGRSWHEIARAFAIFAVTEKLTCV